MKAKLQEALDIVNDICCDINGEYPCGLLRVRRLLKDVLDGAFLDEDDVAALALYDPLDDELVGELGPEPPTPAA